MEIGSSVPDSIASVELSKPGKWQNWQGFASHCILWHLQRRAVCVCCVFCSDTEYGERGCPCVRCRSLASGCGRGGNGLSASSSPAGGRRCCGVRGWGSAATALGGTRVRWQMSFVCASLCSCDQGPEKRVWDLFHPGVHWAAGPQSRAGGRAQPAGGQLTAVPRTCHFLSSPASEKIRSHLCIKDCFVLSFKFCVESIK